MKFKKLVAVEPLNVTDSCRENLKTYADDVKIYTDLPSDNAELIRRIGDANAVLVSYTTEIDREVIERSPNLKYIGMCCSLYAKESANVDIDAAEHKGIVVTGIRDYGDVGVGEYVVSELVRLLHGFGEQMWRDQPMELTGVPIGIIGMGTTGQIVAKALRFFGADVYYYSRTRKAELEQTEGYTYKSLEELLPNVDILCTCLNKNVVLMKEREFALLGDGKILVNTSIAPSHEAAALEKWLTCEGNFILADSLAAIDPTGKMIGLKNVLSPGKSAGITTLAYERLSQKVLDHLNTFLTA